jgi:hypothetical protein
MFLDLGEWGWLLRWGAVVSIAGLLLWYFFHERGRRED